MSRAALPAALGESEVSKGESKVTFFGSSATTAAKYLLLPPSSVVVLLTLGISLLTDYYKSIELRKNSVLESIASTTSIIED